MAITFSVIMLLLVATVVAVYVLAMVTASVQVRRAEQRTRALYVAEAGLQVALQRAEAGTWTGRIGQGRYLVRRGSGEITSLGAVERADGLAALTAIGVQTDGTGVARGTWRLLRPSEYADLQAALLRAHTPPPGAGTGTAR